MRLFFKRRQDWFWKPNFIKYSKSSRPINTVYLYSLLRNSTLKKIVITGTMCLGPLIQIRLQIEIFGPFVIEPLNECIYITKKQLKSSFTFHTYPKLYRVASKTLWNLSVYKFLRAFLLWSIHYLFLNLKMICLYPISVHRANWCK